MFLDVGEICLNLFEDNTSILKQTSPPFNQVFIFLLPQNPGGGYFTINSYGGVRRKDLCYDPIPEFLSDIDTQSQNFEEVTKPIRHQRDKGLSAVNDNFCTKWPLESHWNEVLI